jgi:hypothetical protein
MFNWYRRWLGDTESLGRTGDIAVPNAKVKAYYEGAVDTADYWDPENADECGIAVLLPHGFGKLTYKVEGEVLEAYQGLFFMESILERGNW